MNRQLFQRRAYVVHYGILLLICLVSSSVLSLAAPNAVSYRPVRILDTFEAKAPSGSWWDSDGTRVYDRTIVDTVAQSGRYSMKIHFRKQGCPWSFFAFHPSQNGVDNDFSGFTEVVFWMYAEQSVAIAAKVEDVNRVSIETRMIIPAKEWCKVTIGFHKSHLDRRSIYNVLFFIAPGVAQAQGTLYVDNLVLVSRDLMADIPASSLYTPAPRTTTYGGINACTLHWSQAAQRDWPGIFEITVASNPKFEHPITYWATTNHLPLKQLPVGTYFFRVRAWTHLPPSWGFWGRCKRWSKFEQFTIAPIQTVQILDNFDGDSVVTSWWDIDGRDVYTRQITNTVAANGRSSMHVSYCKTAGYEWSYFTANINLKTTYNLSWLDQLIIWVYHNSGEQSFSILFKLGDADGNVWTSKAIVQGTGSWQRLVLDIPSGSVNLNRLKSLSFFIDPGQADVSGSFYLDGISLASSHTFLAKPSMVSTTVRTTGFYSHSVTWTDRRASGAILYQVRESADTTFHTATSYWTNNTHIDFAKHDAGTWYYQVRSWSHFPEEGGHASFWSRTISVTHKDIPPVIETVTAFFIDDTDNVFPVGAIPRICVYEKYRAADIAHGTILISSSQGKIVEGPMKLFPSESGQYFYAHWNTRALPPGSYRVLATLVDAAGHTATNNKLIIQLKPSLFGDITTLLISSDVNASSINTSVFPPFTRTYDIRWVYMHGVRPAEKVLGSGWSHNYNALLFEYTDGSVELQWGTGRVDFFVVHGTSYINILHCDKLPQLVKNANGSFTVIGPNGITYNFAANGLLSELQDVNGNKTVLKYGAHGFLSHIIGPNGQEINLAYYQNRLVYISDTANRVVHFYYNKDKFLISAINNQHKLQQYAYNNNGQLSTVSTNSVVEYLFRYDNIGSVISIEHTGETTNIERDPAASQLRLSSPGGEWITYTLDSWGNVVGIDTPRGRIPVGQSTIIPGYHRGLK